MNYLPRCGSLTVLSVAARIRIGARVVGGIPVLGLALGEGLLPLTPLDGRLPLLLHQPLVLGHLGGTVAKFLLEDADRDANRALRLLRLGPHELALRLLEVVDREIVPRLKRMLPGARIEAPL